ncbi:MAG TPA: alpha-L-rhamnosidase [Verrucomicrobia bacterium]|nr:alpha-L-rhamnosidase [Verrucomicrobiota bacterium]
MKHSLRIAKPRDLVVDSRHPSAVRLLGSGHWFVDFGTAAFGTLLLTLDAPRGGQATIHLGERLAADGRIDRQPHGCVRYRAVAVPLPVGRSTQQVVIPPDARNTGPAAILMPAPLFEVLPFRYAEIVVGEGMPAVLGDVRRLAVFYPFDESAAAFVSSDDRLNKVWDLCKYSIKATSFCGVYVDGDRERIPYEGDAYINQLCHYGVDAEYEMARQTLEHLLFHPTWPTEWILHCLPMAWADYCYTGRTDLLAAYYDILQRKALLELAREDGLISTADGRVTPDIHAGVFLDKPMRDLVDWPPGSFTQGGTGERDNYEMVPINTVVNAFHLWNLNLLVKVAERLGKSADAERFAGRYRQGLASFHRVCFQGDRFCDGEGSTHASVHASMFPAAIGLVPAGQEASVMAFIRSRGMACSVYGAQYLLDACYRLGAADHALALMTAEHDRGWLNMINVGSTVTLEAWDHRYKNNLDWNHAWGAAPANIIPRFLVGVRPAAPGFDSVHLAPQPASLAAFDAQVPTCKDPIRVTFDSTTARHRWLRFEASMPVILDRAGVLPGVADRDRYQEFAAGSHEVRIATSGRASEL